MNRRRLIGRLIGLAGAAALVPTAAVAVASEQDCADCARVFDREVVLPAMYAKPTPEIMEMARSATHERALREGISHDEAALWVYRQSLVTYTTVPDASDAIADARAEGYLRGRDVEAARQESRVILGETWFINPGSRPLPPQWVKPVTFEAMQADCGARGCTFDPMWLASYFCYGIAHGADRRRFVSQDYATNAEMLAAVDTWRRSLHDG